MLYGLVVLRCMYLNLLRWSGQLALAFLVLAIIGAFLATLIHVTLFFKKIQERVEPTMNAMTRKKILFLQSCLSFALQLFAWLLPFLVIPGSFDPPASSFQGNCRNTVAIIDWARLIQIGSNASYAGYGPQPGWLIVLCLWAAFQFPYILCAAWWRCRGRHRRFDSWRSRLHSSFASYNRMSHHA